MKDARIMSMRAGIDLGNRTELYCPHSAAKLTCECLENVITLSVPPKELAITLT